MFKRDWSTYFKFVNYSWFNSQHNRNAYLVVLWLWHFWLWKIIAAKGYRKFHRLLLKSHTIFEDPRIILIWKSKLRNMANSKKIHWRHVYLTSQASRSLKILTIGLFPFYFAVLSFTTQIQVRALQITKMDLKEAIGTRSSDQLLSHKLCKNLCRRRRRQLRVLLNLWKFQIQIFPAHYQWHFAVSSQLTPVVNFLQRGCTFSMFCH